MLSLRIIAKSCKCRGEYMHNPIFSVHNYGAFDYALKKNPHGEGPERLVSAYEFEFYTDKARGGLRIDGTFYQSCPNGCALTKPGQLQSVIRPYRGYYLNIVTQDPELCDMLDHLPNYFTLWNMGELVKLLHQMLAVEDRTSLVNRMQLLGIACRILAILYQYRKNPQSADSNVLQHQKTLLMADKYIRDHLTEDLSLAALAKLCNLDPTYFHKLYTSAFGRTPAQRILGFRIAAAKTGLIESKVSLGELASKCGFSSQTYFCYKFKQVTGLTPMQYRDMILNKPKK